MSRLAGWWSAGMHEPVRLGGVERLIFTRSLGAGPHLTLLHGFPSSSHDWAVVAPRLAERHSVLLCDFLGFGASAKPREHVYSIHEQADLVEALWKRHRIASTAIVAHDYGVSVAQELLARHAEGRGRAELTAVHLLNGGLYPDLHRPEPVQTALLDPVDGPRISAELTQEGLQAALAPTFAPDYDHRAAATDIWGAVSRGEVILHQLIHYMTDRETHAERWVGALEQADVPLAFVWGMLDPVSGAHIADRIRERLPTAPFTALDHVGHWPPLEAPDRVLCALRTST